MNFDFSKYNSNINLNFEKTKIAKNDGINIQVYDDYEEIDYNTSVISDEEIKIDLEEAINKAVKADQNRKYNLLSNANNIINQVWADGGLTEDELKSVIDALKDCDFSPEAQALLEHYEKEYNRVVEQRLVSEALQAVNTDGATMDEVENAISLCENMQYSEMDKAVLEQLYGLKGQLQHVEEQNLYASEANKVLSKLSDGATIEEIDAAIAALQKLDSTPEIESTIKDLGDTKVKIKEQEEQQKEYEADMKRYQAAIEERDAHWQIFNLDGEAAAENTILEIENKWGLEHNADGWEKFTSDPIGYTGSTIVTFGASVVEGIVDVGETIVDGAVQIGGGLVSYGVSIFDPEAGADMQEGIQNFVEFDASGTAYDAFVQASGIDDDIAYGWAHTAGNTVGQVTGYATISVFTGGAVATVLGGAAAAGSSAETAYASGASFDEAMIASSISGFAGGVAGGAMDKVGTLAKGATSIKGAVGYTAAGIGIGAAEPLLNSVTEYATFGNNDGSSYLEYMDDSNGWLNVAMGGTAGGLSVGGQAIQGVNTNKYKTEFNNTMNSLDDVQRSQSWSEYYGSKYGDVEHVSGIGVEGHNGSFVDPNAQFVNNSMDDLMDVRYSGEHTSGVDVAGHNGSFVDPSASLINEMNDARYNTIDIKSSQYKSNSIVEEMRLRHSDRLDADTLPFDDWKKLYPDEVAELTYKQFEESVVASKVSYAVDGQKVQFAEEIYDTLPGNKKGDFSKLTWNDKIKFANSQDFTPKQLAILDSVETVTTDEAKRIANKTIEMVKDLEINGKLKTGYTADDVVRMIQEGVPQEEYLSPTVVNEWRARYNPSAAAAGDLNAPTNVYTFQCGDAGAKNYTYFGGNIGAPDGRFVLTEGEYLDLVNNTTYVDTNGVTKKLFDANGNCTNIPLLQEKLGGVYLGDNPICIKETVPLGEIKMSNGGLSTAYFGEFAPGGTTQGGLTEGIVNQSKFIGADGKLNPNIEIISHSTNFDSNQLFIDSYVELG